METMLSGSRLRQIKCRFPSGDIYSIGVIVKEVFCRNEPYSEFEAMTPNGRPDSSLLNFVGLLRNAKTTLFFLYVVSFACITISSLSCLLSAEFLVAIASQKTFPSFFVRC